MVEDADSLSENVVVQAVDDADDDIEMGEAAAASTKTSTSSSGWQARTIRGACAICLDHYKVGDVIVSSSNEQCRHAFHQDCVLDYFLHLHQGHEEEEEVAATLSAPCPCCRQSFCHPRRPY
jgi:hypothetical protein